MNRKPLFHAPQKVNIAKDVFPKGFRTRKEYTVKGSFWHDEDPLTTEGYYYELEEYPRYMIPERHLQLTFDEHVKAERGKTLFEIEDFRKP